LRPGIGGQDNIPYWKDYKANVTRGLVAAGLCAAFFIIWFVVQRFLEKKYRSGKGTIGTSNNEQIGLDNLAAVKDD